MSAPMNTSSVSSWLNARGIHYGWVVAGVTFLTMLATAGAMGSAGVLMVPLEKEFGWSKSEISSAFALRLVLFGLLGPFAAAFMNAFGIRAVTLTALGLISSGIVLSLWMREVWQLVALWGVVLGVGTGMTALVLGATVAARWFEKRRGFVVGLLTASNATGQLIFLPLLAAVAESIGWRTALMLVVAVIAFAALLVLIFMRDDPQDVGLAAYGAQHSKPRPVRPGLGAMLASPVQALLDAGRTRIFWVLFFTFFICGFSTNGLVQTHWIAICGDFGIAPVKAAGTLAVIGAFDFVGTIAAGWLSDRYDNRWLLFWFYGLRGLSLLFLPFSDFSLYALALFSVFYGLDWVATVPPTVKLTVERFGAERAGMVFGWIFAGHQLGAAAAAYLAGFFRTEFQSYMPSLMLAGAACLVAAALIVSTERSQRQPEPVAA